MRSARHPPRDLSQSPATALAAVSQPISPPGHHSPLSPPVEQTTRPAASQRATQALGATSAHRGPASQFLPALSITRRWLRVASNVHLAGNPSSIPQGMPLRQDRKSVAQGKEG